MKNLGDGLMVVFASASAALACAVAMQQGVERDNREREHSVGLRVGLSGGEVSREDDDYFGDPVVEAARLCATCESGQILAADIVRAMAGRRSRHKCRSLGALSLKGLPDPVETVEVLWEPLGGVSDTEAGTLVPLPPSPGRAPRRGCGRTRSRDAGHDRRRQARRGGRRPRGGAHLGRGRYGQDHAGGRSGPGCLRHRGLCVVRHCEEDLATPYQLFAEALGHYVTHAPRGRSSSPTSRNTGPNCPGWSPPSPAGSRTSRPRRRPTPTPSGSSSSPPWSACWPRCRQTQPVVFVLDDLQWADKASLAALAPPAAAEQAMRVLVLGTYRDSELSRSHPLTDTLAALHRQHGVSRIELAGLDDSGVMALMEAAAGHTLDDAGVGLAHAVYRETDGNPFFVSEVLRHLAETGAIYQDATGRWTSENSLEQIALPDSVREVIGARVGRLGPDAERVLSMAAVIGRDFDLDLLARADQDHRGRAARHPRRRDDRRRWCGNWPTPPGTTTSPTPSIQHTLYEDLGPTRRARAHRQVAEALEDLCGDRPGTRAGELARHWVNATQPIDLTKAISYSRQAGDAALGALAPADALRHYAQALDLYPQATDPDPVLGTRPGHRARNRPAPGGGPRLSRHPPRGLSPGRRSRRHRAARGCRPGQQPRLVQRCRCDRHRQGRDPGGRPRPAFHRQC